MIHLMLEKDTGRILSAGVFACKPGDAVEVERLPEGDISQYCYIDGEFILEPLPREEEEPSARERIEALEEENRSLKEALDLLLSGDTGEADENG